MPLEPLQHQIFGQRFHTYQGGQETEGVESSALLVWGMLAGLLSLIHCRVPLPSYLVSWTLGFLICSEGW